MITRTHKTVAKPSVKVSALLREEIASYIRQRYVALGVKQSQYTPTSQSVLKLDHLAKVYSHYTSEKFWAKWLVDYQSDFRNIIPSPESRFRHMRTKGLLLINKCENINYNSNELR